MIRTYAVAAALLGLTPAAIAADAELGKQLYAQRGCIGCHGAGGASTNADNPSLTGKSAEYLTKQLHDYRSGARKNAVMNAMSQLISTAEIEHVAAYLSGR